MTSMPKIHPSKRFSPLAWLPSHSNRTPKKISESCFELNVSPSTLLNPRSTRRGVKHPVLQAPFENVFAFSYRRTYLRYRKGLKTGMSCTAARFAYTQPRFSAKKASCLSTGGNSGMRDQQPANYCLRGPAAPEHLCRLLGSDEGKNAISLSLTGRRRCPRSALHQLEQPQEDV